MVDKWMTDGNEHKDLSNRTIFTTTAIENYLNSTRVQFVASNKGMGKTLLLRYKRKILSQKQNFSSIYYLPQGSNASIKGDIDIPDLSEDLTWRKEYDSEEFWSDLWYFSFVLSIATHVDIDEHQKEWFINYVDNFSLSSAFKEDITRRIKENVSIPASVILCNLLNSNIGMFLNERNKLLNNAKEISTYIIKSGVYYFVDAFDSALSRCFKYQVKTWLAGQQGLVLSSYRLFNNNEHIKIFGTIRQEAWNCLHHVDRQAISGKVLLINYSKKELESLFMQAIYLYENEKSIEELVQLDYVINLPCDGERESLFGYILRHIVPTPRALAIIGNGIATRNIASISEINARATEFKTSINAMAVEIVVRDFLLDQQSYFFKNIKTESDLKALCRYIPSNILSGNSLDSIAYWFSTIKRIKTEEAHPFCELYSVGLLGVCRKDPTTQNILQYFKRPNEFEFIKDDIINRDMLYFLHPGLNSYIYANNISFRTGCNIIEDERVIDRAKVYSNFNSIFISHSSKNIHEVENWLSYFKKHLDILIPNKLWIDKNEIPYGGDIEEYIAHGLKSSALLFLFLTPESITSGWVKEEWESMKWGEIDARKIKIYVIMKDLKQSDLPDYLKKKKYFDYYNHKSEEELRKLASDISKEFLSGFPVTS